MMTLFIVQYVWPSGFTGAAVEQIRVSGWLGISCDQLTCLQICLMSLRLIFMYWFIWHSSSVLRIYMASETLVCCGVFGSRVTKSWQGFPWQNPLLLWRHGVSFGRCCIRRRCPRCGWCEPSASWWWPYHWPWRRSLAFVCWYDPAAGNPVWGDGPSGGTCRSWRPSVLGAEDRENCCGPKRREWEPGPAAGWRCAEAGHGDARGSGEAGPDGLPVLCGRQPMAPVRAFAHTGAAWPRWQCLLRDPPEYAAGVRGLLLWAATRWRWPRRRLGGAGPNRFDRLGLAVIDAYKQNELVMVQLKAVSLMGMNKEISLCILTASFWIIVEDMELHHFASPTSCLFCFSEKFDCVVIKHFGRSHGIDPRTSFGSHAPDCRRGWWIGCVSEINCVLQIREVVNWKCHFSPPARWGLLDFMSVACSSSSSSPRLLSSSPLLRLPAGPQPRPSTPSVPCRTSTTTITAQCALPDLNHDHHRPVFPAGPQPRPSTPSVPCRTSTASIPAQCSLPDLNHDHPRPVFPAGPQPRVSTPKDMPHRVPEDMPDRMLEDMPDRMSEGMPDRMPDRMSARMPEDMPDKVPECLPDRMPADLPDNMPEDMLDRMPDGMPEDLPDNMPEYMPDRMLDGMPEDMPEHMPEDMSEDMPEHLPEDMPEHLPEDMPGRMPEDMPDRMPDRMPENMSDRMPEDLPVTKCINVMVGITRSKVNF